MRPSVRVLTLGVDDLQRSLTFYRDGLGLATDGIVGEEFEHGAVAFFHLAGGLILALWPTTSLSKDANIETSRSRLGSVSIGHIARSKEEVDEVIEAARRAGATRWSSLGNRLEPRVEPAGGRRHRDGPTIETMTTNR
jgi:catechol 2,3-dioxygenase-like lactoylglutathione lyase family enzyme